MCGKYVNIENHDIKFYIQYKVIHNICRFFHIKISLAAVTLREY